MRNILLSTTALTMTAGIAAADVSVSGSFKLGFNDTEAGSTAASGFRQAVVGSHDGTTAVAAVAASENAVALKKNDNNYGVYNDAGITFAMSSTMDNGMTAAITADMNGGDTTNNAAGADNCVRTPAIMSSPAPVSTNG